MKRNLTTLWMLLLMIIVGGGNVWGETISFSFSNKFAEIDNVKNGSVDLTIYPITLTLTSYNSDRSVEVNKKTQQIKFQGKSGDNGGTSFTVSCPNNGKFSITSVEVFTDNSNVNNFSVNGTPISSASTTGDETSIGSNKGSWSGSTTSVTFQTTGNVDAVKAIRITYTDSRASLTPAFDYGKMEIHNTAGDEHTYVCGTPFVYEPSKDRLKVRITVTPRYSGIYGTISSSDETVLKTSGFSLTGPTAVTIGGNDGWEMYIDNIEVLKTGSATLRFWFNGNDDYKPTTLEVPITVIDHSITPFNNSYKYTWDFAGGDWSSTIAQLGYGNGDGGYNWTKTVDSEHAEARPTYNEHTSIPTYNGLDMITGLAFNLPVKSDICLDWFAGRKAVWLNTNATVTIPNLVKGQTITITADHDDFTITAGSATKSGSVITVTDAGSVTIKMAQATRISSIAVSNSSYGWSYTTTTTTLDKVRPTSGTFTFTEDGPIAGGKVINEVPGISLTVGASGTDYEVMNHASVGYASPCLEYLFSPTVNGYLTVNMYSANSHTYIRENNGAFIDITASGNIYNGDYTTPNDHPLKAGNTYKLHVKTDGAYNPIYLHSFTFRPAFLNPTTNTDQLSINDETYGNKFVARIGSPAKNAFPKLINPSSTEQQNKVKFASDKDKVYLYKNNDVEIIGNGENILVRGTVLDKNNEDGLVAYYYLNAYVLTVTSYELADQAYIATSGLTDGKYQIEFSGNIQAVGSSVVVQIMKDNETVQNVTATITDKILYIPFDAAPFASLEEGATYRITIPENSIALTADAETKNSAIERTFSVNKADELQVKMIYPTNIATVGTTIVLATYLPDGSASFNLNDRKKVKAILSASGESDMELSAAFSGNQMAFKPTRTLSYNKEYTLTINYNADNNVITSLEVNSTIYKVTHSKVFKFTTGSSSGTSPVVTETSPVANAVIPGTAYSGGTISFTFNQAVELEPYSEVKVTPINGSEATTTGKTLAPDNAAQNTLVLSNGGKTVSFDYSADGLKYDVYYQVVIPANTVIGAGGLPNTSDITLNFKMGSKPTSEWKVATAFTGYPYSWDFSKFGVLTSSKTDLDANAPDDPTTGTSEEKNKKKTQATATRWQKTGTDEYANYWTNNMVFPQGEVFSYKTTTPSEAEVEIAEMRGLRWSLASRNSGGTLKRVNIRKYGDGYYLQMAGGTHYLTIPGLTAGQKIYIRAQVSGGNEASRFNINSDNAVFTDKYQAGNNKLGVKDNVTHVYPVSVTADGDVTFCLQDVSFYQIAVAVDDAKKFNDYEGKSYTTEYRPNATERYDLSEILGGYSVTAKVPTAASVTDEEEKTGKLTLTEAAVIPSATPVILVCSSTGGPSVPLFAADVNTATPPVEGTNLLIGNPGPKIYAPVGSYILTTQYRDIDQNGNPRGDVQTGPLAFYRVYKANYNGIAANRAYLSDVLNPGASGAKLGYYFVGDDDTPTVISQLYQDDRLEEDGSSTYYNINGQKLSGRPTVPGIYISNGKKIIIK